MPEAARLLPLAESIADGSPVDWESAETHATAEEREIIRELRVLADLALLHRSLPADPGEPHASGGSTTAPAPGMTAAVLDTTAPAIGNWGHLALVERLGGGTAGEVYRAWDRQLECDVALKLLRVNEASNDPHSSPIVREGRLLARVRHPNVITVHGVAVHEGRFGLWMELVRGATLEQLLARRGPFSAREAALIGIDLCRALAAIHAAGLIHRDVKAQNVMREDGGRIVLMDLGTGREIDSGRRHTMADLAGTPLYLAPEIFAGGAASERTDLYSLGVLLYHLVTGTFPVRAAAIGELTERHAKGAGVRLRDARADLPTRFVQVIDRATARDPQGRYASAGALEADLAAALGDDHASASADGAAGNRAAGKAGWRRGGAVLATLAAVLALVAIGWPVMRGRIAPSGVSGTITSIAVLPMANLSGDPSQEYFADGMTDALIGDLAKIRPLRVISRTSIMQYKGTNTPLLEIANALNVDAVLEASVLRSGDRVRVSADLVHVASDRHVWADTYERDVRDVLALQSDLARTIAREVKIQLAPQQAGFGAASPVDPAAYDAYLQGRYYWNKRRLRDLRTGLEYFQRAVSLDPAFARAYAGIADSHNLLIGEFPPRVTYARAKAAALKALELDQDLAEAQTSLAFAKFVFDRDLSGAEDGFRRAIDLNANYALAHHWYAEYLSAMNRPLDAKREIEIARTLDPLSTSVRGSNGSILYMAREYDRAIAHFRTSLDLQPDDAEAHYYLGLLYAQKRMLAEATAEMRQALAQAGRSQTVMAGAAYVAAVAGRTAEAMATIRELDKLSQEQWVDPGNFAVIYAALGDRDNAVKWLRKAFEDRAPGLMWASVDPALDSVRSDLRFVELMRALGLAP
jgi:TolB-like protein/tetratricopeptide (TPR) repeat protein